MFSKIVVGYGGDDRAKQAVNAALDLAQRLSAELHIVTGVPKDRLRDLEGGPERRAVDMDDARLALGQLVKGVDGVEVSTVAHKGSPADALLAETERVDGDLIVVGNKNVQGVSRVLGSVASEVARRAPCEVLIINTNPARD